MFIHLVFLLSLSWSHVIGTEKADTQDEVVFDQIATASENVAQNTEKSAQEQKDFRDQLIPSMVDATIHYENSNGFVPMLTSTNSRDPPRQPSAFSAQVKGTSNNFSNEQNATKSTEETETESSETDETEEDPAYSTEARIFLNLPEFGANRRSFDFQDAQNEFELLKVKNDTPAVANYQDFYEDENDSEDNRGKSGLSSSAHRSHDRGKRIENYMNAYGSAATQNSDKDSSSNRYYYNTAKDKKKATYESEKVAGNYHQQDATSYDGHGQNTRQNVQATSSLPRTNQEVNDLMRSGAKNHDYDNVAAKSRHRLSRPVVVAEPSDYHANDAVVQTEKMSDMNSEDYHISRAIDSVSAETSNRYAIFNRDGRFRGYEQVDDSRDASEDSMDEAEYTERPRRVHKPRRRPISVETSKRLPKEHRGSSDSFEHDNHGKRHQSRTKGHRQRVKTSWVDEDRKRGQEESIEETRYDDRLIGSATKGQKGQSTKFKPSNGWNQVSPNLEISHSSGIEIGQLEKPKFIVPVNLVPVTNFDHATALDSSQGFDMSNAVLQNFVTGAPISVSTGSLINTQGLQNVPKANMPDVVVGQNSFQNPMHAVLPASSANKFANLRSQYVTSTVGPLYAVSPGLNQNLQDVQGAVTPRPTYIATSSPATTMQHTVPHLIVPQPTLQTLQNYVPLQSNSDYNIQVNPHGLHGQNLVNHVSTVTSAPQVPATKVNLLATDSQNKKHLLQGASSNFLATASLAVGQNEKQADGNSYYVQGQGAQQLKPQVRDGLYQVLKNVNLTPKTKTYIQTTHLIPAVLHPVPTLTAITANTPQYVPEQSVQSAFVLQQPRDQSQYVKIQSSTVDAMQQLQLQLREQMLKNAKLQNFGYQTVDNVGSQTSSNVNTLNGLSGVTGMVETAHLPNVGTKNVEILNPNIKPSPIDTTILNAYETMQYPTAVLTTPIPMFSTTSFVTARPVVSTTSAPVQIQNFVDSLTAIGAKGNQVDLKAYQSQDRPMFNPINFVPNMEVVKNQNALNSKLHATEPLQQNLNLVPLIPGGNFFKPSFTAQSELVVKPKLNSDLEKYAEQMFKESLKTIYNSQKWNNDRKPLGPRHNISDGIDLSKLRHELHRLKASLTDSKYNKDPYEAHHSETKVRTTEAHRDQKKPDELLAALEQMLKAHPTDPLRSHHSNGRPNRPHRPGNQGSPNFSTDTKHINDFLTPPKPNSHRSKNPFHDKPGKKRPGSGPPRFNGKGHFSGPRPHSRPKNIAPKSAGLEASASNVDGIHADGPRFDSHPRSHYDREHDFGRHHGHSDFWKGSSSPFDPYPSFTTSSPENSGYGKLSKSHKVSSSKEIDINHPRMHNLLGLLMKNKQLPPGSTQSYFRDRDQLRQFFEDEKRRLQQQFYDDTLRDYLSKTTDGSLYSGLRSNITGGRRSFVESTA